MSEKLTKKEKEELMKLLDSSVLRVEVHLESGLSISMSRKVFESLETLRKGE